MVTAVNAIPRDFRPTETELCLNPAVWQTHEWSRDEGWAPGGILRDSEARPDVEAQ